MADLPLLPVWARRVPQAKIRQLYENDARGIYDEALIEEVGYSLLARCQSFLDACEAVAGRAPCPACGTIIAHAGQKEEILKCPNCGWALSWGDYFATIQHHQLSGAEPVRALFQEYIRLFPAAQSAPEKVFLIDRLIHGFHWYYKNGKPTRPVAVNLIQGKLTQVIDFLESLSCGENSTPGVQQQRAEWEKNVETARSWYREEP